MIINQHKHQKDQPLRKVLILGYSQSGKSSRINCIERQLRGAREVSIKSESGPKISIKFKSQSRHITPYDIAVKLRHGDIKVIAVDYTGQDHQAAYYFLKKMYDIIQTIRNLSKSDIIIKNIFDNIINISNKIIDVFVMGSETAMKVEDFKKIITNPFEPFTEIAKKYEISLDSVYKDVVAKVVGVLVRSKSEDQNNWRWPGEIESLKNAKNFVEKYTETLDNILKNIGLEQYPVIRVNELNRILCRIDTAKLVNNRYEWNKDCDNYSFSNIEIERIGTLGWLRGFVAGPLLAYLFLGLVIDSWITIILMPANFKKWYEMLKRIYITDVIDTTIDTSESQNKAISDKDIEIKTTEINTMMEGIKHYIRLDEKIEKGVKDICRQLINQYLKNHNKSSIDEEKFNIIKDEICSFSSSRSLECKPIADNPRDIINGVKDYVCKNLIILWGEVLARIYHYELVNVLLNLYELYIKYKHSELPRHEKHFVFDLTYCEKDSDQVMSLYESLNSILSLDVSHEQEHYVEQLKNVINALSLFEVSNNNININIHFLPSSMSDAIGDCTPFETILIICMNDVLSKVNIINKNTNEKEEIDCKLLLNHTRLNWISENILKKHQEAKQYFEQVNLLKGEVKN